MLRFKSRHKANFHMNKWFLDFVGDDGEVMIFYAASMTWKRWYVPYTSWYYYHPEKGIQEKSNYRKVQFPKQEKEKIFWKDAKFKIEGTWEATSDPINEVLYESERGNLEWSCLQPSSNVTLKWQDRILKGKGYVEQLNLTSYPWDIGLEQLRWGRYGSDNDHMVWVDFKKTVKQQWLWLNGEKIDDCIIEDDHIYIPGKSLLLELDKGVILESKKKINVIVKKLIHYIPGFKKVIPKYFLMADECKWFSAAKLKKGLKECSSGYAIHELVDFK